MWQPFLDYITIVAGFAAAASVFYLARQVKITIDEAKINRSHDFIKRFNDPVFGRMLSDALFFLKDKEKLKYLFDKTNINVEAIKTRQTISISLNFFEEIGELYNRGMLNAELIEDFFATASKHYYQQVEKYIRWRTEQTGRKNLYKEWRVMNSIFRGKGL